MGEGGVYQLFAAGGHPIGGMMNRPAVMPMSWWNYYINVDAIDAATARVEKAGGSIKMGPMEVPGGQWGAAGSGSAKRLFRAGGTQAIITRVKGPPRNVPHRGG